MMHTKTLSPRDLAKAIGASESSVKRWVDDGAIPASKTAGGHRRIALPDAIEYVRRNGIGVVRSDLLDIAVASEAGGGGAVDEQLLRFLSEGRAFETRSLLLSAYLEGRGVASLCDGPIRQAMTRIGELWLDDPRGVFIEHRATMICLEAIDLLRMSIQPSTAGGPQAVGAACEGDPSLLPSLMAATVLGSEGFQAVNLGASTPAVALRHAIEHHQPAMAWLSVNHVPEADLVSRDVRQLLPWLEKRKIHLVLGGRSAPALDLPRSANLYVAESLGELAALARGFTAR